MILKSIIRMRSLLTVLIVTLILVSFTVSSVIQLGTGYTTTVFKTTAENNRPHLVLRLQKNSRAYINDIMINNSTAALEHINKRSQELRELIEPFAREARDSPLINCTEHMLTFEGGPQAPLYIIFFPYGSYSEAKVNLSERRGHRVSPEIVTATIPYPGPEEERLPLQARLGLRENSVTVFKRLNETWALQVTLSYYIGALEVILVESLETPCLNLNSSIPATPGDGIFDAFAPSMLVESLGLSNGSEVDVGGGKLRLWGVPTRGIAGMRGPGAFNYPRFIIAPMSELPDLLQLGSRAPDNMARFLAIGIGAGGIFFPFTTQVYANETLETAKSILGGVASAYTGRTIVVPSPTLMAVSNPQYLASLIQELPQDLTGVSDINRTIGQAQFNFMNTIDLDVILNYDPGYLLASKRADIGMEIYRLSQALNNTLAHWAKEHNCTFYSSIVEIEPLATEGTEPGEDFYVDFRFSSLRAEIQCAAGQLTLSAWFVEDKLDRLLAVKYGGQFEPLIVLSLVSLIPAVFLMGIVMTGEGLNLIIGTMRRWLATASARGATSKALTRPFLNLMLALSIIAIVLGLVLSSVATGYILMGLPPTDALGLITSNKPALIATVVAVPLVAWIGTRGRMREVRGIRAIEAVRPAMAIRSAFQARVGKGSMIVLALTVLAVLTAFLRPTEDVIERVQESAGVIGIAIIVIMLALGVFFAPFTPIIVLHEGSKIISASRKLERLVVRTVSVFSRKESLTGLGESSGLRVKEMLLSYLRAGILGLGLSMGSLLSASALTSQIPRWLTRTAEESPYFYRDLAYTLASVDSTALILRLLGAIAAIATIIIVLSSTGAIFNVMRRQVAVLRARGARRVDVIRYVYFSFLHSILMLVLGGLLLAGAYFITIDSVVSVSFIDLWDSTSVPHLIPRLDLVGGLLVVGLLGAILLSPLIVSYRIARERDIGRLLREEV